jgi:hypothetical protein
MGERNRAVFQCIRAVELRGQSSSKVSMSTVSLPLDQLLDPFVACLTPDVAEKVVNLRASEKVQERLTYLAEQSNEGRLTEEEGAEYDRYLQAIDLVTVLQAKARSYLREKST